MKDNITVFGVRYTWLRVSALLFLSLVLFFVVFGLSGVESKDETYVVSEGIVYSKTTSTNTYSDGSLMKKHWLFVGDSSKATLVEKSTFDSYNVGDRVQLSNTRSAKGSVLFTLVFCALVSVTGFSLLCGVFDL